jgi:hypothetical protein
MSKKQIFAFRFQVGGGKLYEIHWIFIGSCSPGFTGFISLIK